MPGPGRSLVGANPDPAGDAGLWLPAGPGACPPVKISPATAGNPGRFVAWIAGQQRSAWAAGSLSLASCGGADGKVRMRVLVLTNCYPNEHKVYAGMFVRRHVEFHREMGVEVTVLAPGDSRQGGWRSAWKYLWLFLRVWKVLLFGQFDLVHAHWPFPAGLYALFFSRLRRKPFVLTSHGAFVDNLDQYPRLLRWLVRLVLRRADVLIVVGREHRERV